MTLSKFVEKHLDTAVDFDGHYGAQCVDLVRQKWQEIDRIPQPEPTDTQGAAAFYFKHERRPIQRQHLNCITYQPGMIPPPGAVVIFKATSKNPFGHIGICIVANERAMEVFEQCGIENSKRLTEGRKQKGVYIGAWGYDRLLGWLIKR